ncbi:MAG: hypothetical protein E6I95_10700 [Chloroflexi bacterium]|nr:MAG: hypothetical protein E6I95_10700 [Chloroflexota bacterium]
MTQDLSLDLHALTARLDRGADRILRKEAGISYPRFLLLFMVGETTTTQRSLAQRMGVTEPSISRMVATLVGEGLLRVDNTRGGGNRHSVRLSARGRSLVQKCYSLLESRLVDLVKASGVPYEQYARHTKRLLATLEAATAPLSA